MLKDHGQISLMISKLDPSGKKKMSVKKKEDKRLKEITLEY